MDVSPSLACGLHAYAEKEAAIFQKLSVKFMSMWLPLLHKAGTVPEWAKDFTDAMGKSIEEEGSEDEVEAESDIPEDNL